LGNCTDTQNNRADYLKNKELQGLEGGFLGFKAAFWLYALNQTLS
jgi:hypothetical protein